MATVQLAWRQQLRRRVLGTVIAQQRRCWVSTEALSIRWGPKEPSLYNGTIPEHFVSVVSAYGDRPAVIARSAAPAARETTLTYDGLDRMSNRLAASLASLGVRKGDRVAVSLGNGPEFAALTYAAFKLGAVLVPLNPGFNERQVAAALSHLDASVLIIGAMTDLPYRPGRGRSNWELLRSVAGDLGGSEVRSEAVPSLRRVVVLDNTMEHPETAVGLDVASLRAATPYADLLAASSDRPVTPSAALDANDCITIQFTSGTTSLPKAAMLSHRNVLNNGALIAHRMGLDPQDRIAVPPPLFHCFGCVLGYMATATTGAAILFPSPAFDPAATLRMCVDHDATGLYGVSTMFIAVLDLLAAGGVVDSPPKSLLKGIAAGSSVPESLMCRLHSTLGLHDLVICYGMTETSPVSVMTSPADPLVKRTGSVGRAMPHTGVKVVDPHDHSAVVPIGRPGELAAAGYLVMAGYYGAPEQTAAVRVPEADGHVWIYSGDEAVMDADGYVSITGRIKDLIIRGGENIHPLEVEDCLMTHGAVREASVVGVPDERLGEAVVAFVVPARGCQTGADDASDTGTAPGQRDGRSGDGESESGPLTPDVLRKYVARRLSKHLAPKYILWTDEYPKTASGKIQKFKLRDVARARLGLDDADKK